ncbi:MAG: hypothetical protein HZA54_07270 [Planctomycetes bacterium]|nr:hypothetical protein [Planctomycetota bacterium]
MTASRLIIVPADPDFVPEPATLGALRAALAAYAAPAAIHVAIHSHPVFIDPGGVGEIVCPLCRELIPDAWWRSALSRAAAGHHHHLLIRTPCCNAHSTLNDLIYEYPARFARFVAEVANPTRPPSDEETLQLQELLGCPIRYVRVRR